jgi:hypothetical protein
MLVKYVTVTIIQLSKYFTYHSSQVKLCPTDVCYAACVGRCTGALYTCIILGLSVTQGLENFTFWSSGLKVSEGVRIEGQSVILSGGRLSLSLNSSMICQASVCL